MYFININIIEFIKNYKRLGITYIETFAEVTEGDYIIIKETDKIVLYKSFNEMPIKEI